MSGFDDREKGYERKFEHDQELAFKIRARRNKLVGLWAADCLGLKGAEAEHYAREVLAADLEKPGVDDVVGKIARDFAARGVSYDEARIRVELQRFTVEAKKQLGGAR